MECRKGNSPPSRNSAGVRNSTHWWSQGFCSTLESVSEPMSECYPLKSTQTELRQFFSKWKSIFCHQKCKGFTHRGKDLYISCCVSFSIRHKDCQKECVRLTHSHTSTQQKCPCRNETLIPVTIVLLFFSRIRRLQVFGLVPELRTVTVPQPFHFYSKKAWLIQLVALAQMDGWKQMMNRYMNKLATKTGKWCPLVHNIHATHDLHTSFKL